MKKLKFIILAAGLASTITSCRKWLDINFNPTVPSYGNAEVMLPPMQFHMANGTANDYRFLFKTIQNWGSQAADNFWEAHGYEPGNDNGGTIWRMTYINFGPNMEQMIQDATAKGKWTYAGIGYAMKAWAYQLTTDLHGPIILDQAMDSTRLFFNYQEQNEVYAKVRKWCDSSIACFTRQDAINYDDILKGPSGDQLYKGDRAKWRKFVYAVLAQQYSHLRNKSLFQSQYADSVVKYVDLSFANSSEDATVPFAATSSADGNVFSPNGPANLVNITTTATQQYTGRITSTIVNMLTGGVRGTPTLNPKSSVDPRLSRMMAYSPQDSVYRGVVPTFGDPATVKRVPLVWGAVNATSWVGKYLYYPNSRYPILSYAQLQFAKAEALFVKGETGNAHQAYLNGIKGHMDFVNLYGTAGNGDKKITQAEIDAYMLSSEVAQTPAELGISDIMTQKYIAQWGWAGMETFSDLRKYHYDINVFKQLYAYLPEDIVSGNKGKLCYRFRPRYNSEYVWNKDELAKWGGLDVDYNTKETWSNLP
ncbi:SusD/RagB family nutrient-binding outer membrane lipoprotein [Pseudoflavitalea sp. G-6-1-2]|uniref:SusD/RagB family nutrient-binding outer membrane lipoprotein n=1 Tax=Pseudoflavitalea sp. G-6-1-2 TaxID=2728841 RepID=UPI00146CF191|nr:SusD/RagB family nutrient-binding outer membrane lipoprotein [Pseudoflavitalea sp. G-6-1-2]NML23791.1 SusD/RagB family nutrient-binding outer membrane lipoprotein [Pseudoflavitalea sp. G-6-1-2]